MIFTTISLWLLNTALILNVSGSIQNTFQDLAIYHEKEMSKIDCVLGIAEKNVNCGTLINVKSENDMNFWLKSLNDNDCYVTTNIQDLKFIADAYIIVIDGASKFEKTLSELANNTFWNPRAKFIIFFEEQDRYEQYHVFEMLLHYNIINVVVLDYKDVLETNAYTYFPYDIGVCGKHVNEIIYLGTCKNTDDVFPDKLIYGLRNCSITVAITEDAPFVIFQNSTKYHGKGEGMELYLLSGIGIQENITIKYSLVSQTSRHGILLPNRSGTGLLEYLDNHAASMIAGGFLLTKNRAEKYDYIFNYNYPIIQLYTSATREATWKKVYNKFNYETWLLIGISYLFVSIIIAVINSVSKNQDTHNLFLKTWGYFFGNTDKNLIKRNNIRSIMIFWIWFTFFICSFYTTTFYNFLTRYRKVNLNINFKDIQSLPFKPCINDAVRMFFKFSFNVTLPEKDSLECRFEMESLAIVSEKHDLYTVEFEYPYMLKEDQFTDDEGNPKVDTWNLANTISSILTSRGFPFTSLFQRYVPYYFESGLVAKHLGDIYFKNRPNEANLKKRKFKKFRLSDLRFVFIVLFLGYFISTVTFIIELNR